MDLNRVNSTRPCHCAYRVESDAVVGATYQSVGTMKVGISTIHDNDCPSTALACCAVHRSGLVRQLAHPRSAHHELCEVAGCCLMSRLDYKRMLSHHHLSLTTAEHSISSLTKSVELLAHIESHLRIINHKTPATSAIRLSFIMDDYPDPLADYRQRTDFKGWPKPWYKDENDNNYIHCPACCKVLYDNTELQTHLSHYEVSEFPNTNFQHRILQAMCKERKCPYHPQCIFYRLTRKMSDGEFDTDIRILINHEREEHGTMILSDMGEYMNLVRERREKEFGGDRERKGRELWPELFKYYKRNIRANPNFALFNVYIKIEYFPNGLTDSRLNQLAKEWRKSHFADDFPGASEEDKKKYELCYPLKTNEFLRTFQRPNRPDLEGLEDYQLAWDEMVKAFHKGKF